MSINEINARLDEVMLELSKITKILELQRNETLLERIKSLEKSIADQDLKLDALKSIQKNLDVQNIKLDALNAIEPTIIAPAATAVTVKVADDNAANAPAATAEPSFATITSYFKYIWINARDSLYEKGVFSQTEYDAWVKDNPDKFEKKKNELVLQGSIAPQIWKSLSAERKAKVYAMKDQYMKDRLKEKSNELKEA